MDWRSDKLWSLSFIPCGCGAFLAGIVIFVLGWKLREALGGPIP